MIKIKFVQIHTYRSVLLTKAFLATQQLTVPFRLYSYKFSCSHKLQFTLWNIGMPSTNRYGVFCLSIYCLKTQKLNVQKLQFL